MVAILLHYGYMSTFAWTLVESLHVYRMLTEVRNIDAGPMRFYYVVGWGIPAIVTGEHAQSSPARAACVGVRFPTHHGLRLCWPPRQSAHLGEAAWHQQEIPCLPLGAWGRVGDGGMGQ